MSEVDVSRFQGLLVGQVIASSIGALLLAVEDFSGYYYGSYYAGYQEWGSVDLGSGFLSTILLLAAIAGLLIALRAGISSLQAKENVTAALLKKNAQTTIRAAGFTVVLAAVGALIFAISNIIDETEWWLDAGFYGAFVGGLLTVFFAKMISDRIETD